MKDQLPHTVKLLEASDHFFSNRLAEKRKQMLL